jgi:hypothetical protein
MDKTAQKMRLSKLREKLSPTGRLEEFFQPRFKEVMDNLRLGDDTIRSIVAGEKLGDGDPGKHAVSLKDLMKSAKSNINRREYMRAIADVSRFHDKLREVAKALTELDVNVDKVHRQFLYQDLDDDHRPHLEDLENRWKAAQARQAQLRKEAGIMDIWHNLTNERGIALRKWEKQYPERTKELKKALVTLQSEGEKTTDTIIGALKTLAGLRASRNPEEYMKFANSKSGILGPYTSFDKLFQQLYTGNGKFSIQKFIADMKDFTARNPVSAKEVGDQSVPVDKEKMKIKTDIGPDIKTNVTVPPPGKAGPSHLSMPPAPVSPGQTVPAPAEQAPDTLKTGPHSGMEDPHALPYSTTIPAPAPIDPQSKLDALNRLDARHTVAPVNPQSQLDALNRLDARHTVAPQAGSGVVPRSNLESVNVPPPSLTPEAFEQEGGHNLAKLMRQDQGQSPGTPTMVSNTHANFFNSLQKMSNESPLLLASYISKYAKKIQEADPATSIQLLKIVKRIKG